MAAKYKVGDKVVIKSKYDEGKTNYDYIWGFTQGMLNEWGGKTMTVQEVSGPRYGDGSWQRDRVPDDGYNYYLDEDDKEWIWSSSMFEEPQEKPEQPQLYYFVGNAEHGKDLLAKLIQLTNATNDVGFSGERSTLFYTVEPATNQVQACNLDTKWMLRQLGAKELVWKEKGCRVKEDEQYYWINDQGTVKSSKDNRADSSNKRYEFGNYFRTKEEAELEATRWSSELLDYRGNGSVVTVKE